MSGKCAPPTSSIIIFITSLPIQILIHYFAQTFTTLYLDYNKIGAQGAEHLANALQQNKVKSLSPVFLYASIDPLFLEDNHNA